MFISLDRNAGLSFPSMGNGILIIHSLKWHQNQSCYHLWESARKFQLKQGPKVRVAAVLDRYGNNDEQKDCGEEWSLLRARKYLPKENDKFRSFNPQSKSQSKNHSASIADLKESFLTVATGLISTNQKQTLLRVSVNDNVRWFTTSPSSSCGSQCTDWGRMGRDTWKGVHLLGFKIKLTISKSSRGSLTYGSSLSSFVSRDWLSFAGKLLLDSLAWSGHFAKGRLFSRSALYNHPLFSNLNMLQRVRYIAPSRRK